MWAVNDRDHTWMCDGPSPEAWAFHRGLAAYRATDLVDLPDLAAQLGIGRLLAKNEADRLGLPAFKGLGASWAINQVLAARTDSGPATIVTATDGNHGRAVAHFSRLLGHRATIVIPPGVHPQAVQAVIDEGAHVVRVQGSYDDAVAHAADLARAPGHLLVQDTAWEGYQDVPAWIVEGYATMFGELDAQAQQLGVGQPDLVIVPAGVGSLLQGALQHYRSAPHRLATRVACVEPETAACVLASVEAGQATAVPTSTTLMSGLNCGTVSSLAWPYIRDGLDAAVAITDAAGIQAARDLGDLGVAAGPCGGAGLGALRLIMKDERLRFALDLGPTSVVAVLITEGSQANPLPD